MMPDPSQAPAPQDEATAADQNEPAFIIEIYAMQDGTFKVECESWEEQEQEDQAGGETAEAEQGAGGDNAQMANSIEEALSIAKQMYHDQAGEDSGSKQAGFDSVFSTAGGKR